MSECSPLTCMLVCIFSLRKQRTRDRGCSAHPAFPAPSDLRERRIWIARANHGREIANAYLSPCRPCESRDPYAAAAIVGNERQTALQKHRGPVVMGPCFRRGDERAQIFARYAAKNIRVALSTTAPARSGEGAGATWKTNGRNSEAWHIRMNCEAARWQSSIARSPDATCALR